MFYVFVVECLPADGKPYHYAHMMLAESQREAERWLGESFDGTTTKMGKVILFGEHDGIDGSKRRKTKWDVYDEACGRASQLDRETPQTP